MLRKKKNGKIKTLLKCLELSLVLILFFLAVLLLVTVLPFKTGYKALTVQSGSMTPTLPTGSLIVIATQPSYQIGDVITYNNQLEGNELTTHRIYQIKKTNQQSFYLTKGDANNGPDAKGVLPEQIIGKVVFHVPGLGYLINIAKTPPVFLTLVFVPAGLIIASEIKKIKKEVKKIRARKKRLAKSL